MIVTYVKILFDHPVPGITGMFEMLRITIFKNGSVCTGRRRFFRPIRPEYF
jgi:hypothetical protein